MSACRQRRAGLFGGSFDPVHNGHLAAARAAMEVGGLDRVVFIPAATSPFKRGGTEASGADRLAMLRLATDDDLRMEVSDLEIRKAGVSYTIDTVRHFVAVEPDTRWFFILGADSLEGLHAWREADALVGLCGFITLARPGWDVRELDGFDPGTARRLLDGVVRDFREDVSSTGIRSRLAAGESIEDDVPPAVGRYIAEHQLYAPEW